MDRKELNEKLDTFLAEHKLSSGGWAPVSRDEMDQLSIILSMIIGLKYQADPDGDVPVQYRLVDRTVCWPLHFSALLYEDKQLAGTSMTYEEVLLANLRRANSNLQTAAGQVEQCQRALEEAVRVMKNKDK